MNNCSNILSISDEFINLFDNAMDMVCRYNI